MNNLKEVIEDCKQIALKELSRLGINRSFTLKTVKSGIQPRTTLAMYKSRSQFLDCGPIFYLYQKTIVNCVQEQINRDKEDGIPRDFLSEIYRVIADTIVHEFGHVIFEIFTLRNTAMKRFILKNWKSEEHFAEDFMRYLRSSRIENDAHEKCFQRVIRGFKKLTSDLKHLS